MFKKLVLLLTFVCTHLFSSNLDRIIPPEVVNDSFYDAIYKLSQNKSVKTILEIGSSSGNGSTEAFVRGMVKNPNQPTLYCIELSYPRFLALQQRYRYNPFVICYNVSSVPPEAFPSEEEVLYFMRTEDTSLRGTPESEVIRWLREDLEYLQRFNVSHHGIELIKSERKIEHFDLVLIDGSEFTGLAELKLVYGARFILLDDIRAFKNYYNFQRLSKDPNYRLIEVNRGLRNGYAIFERIEEIE